MTTTKKIEVVVLPEHIAALGSIHTIVDDLQTRVMKLDNTSKKIRYLLSEGKKISEVYNLLKKYGVTTKEGGEIRYQHVRNVAMTKLSSN